MPRSVDQIRRAWRCAGVFAAAAATPTLALALAQSGGGFLFGLLHPILGIEHLTAMILVGVLSVQVGGAAIWATPTAFMLVMSAGGVVGLSEVPAPYVESVVALSVFWIGLMIALQARPPLWLAIAAVGFFAFFHGHAHGYGVQFFPNPASYVGGFMLATGALHLIGLGLGEGCHLFRNPAHSRALIGAGGCGVGLQTLLLSFSGG